MRWSKYALALMAAGALACSGSQPLGPAQPVFTVLAQGFALTTGSDSGALFEGIVVDGQSVYVASFARGTVVRLSAANLSILGSTGLPQAVEGLTVGSDGSLLAVHRDLGLSVVAIPALTPLALHTEGGGFFVESLSGERALTSGGHPLTLLDTQSGSSLGEFVAEGAVSMWHFAVAPDGSEVAAIRTDTTRREIHILSPELEPVASLDLTAYTSLIGIAYDPDGTKLYVMARDANRNDHFVAIDLAEGRAQDVPLGQSRCINFCVANHVATSREGRWVVFAEEGRAFFIDTTTDLPASVIEAVFVVSGVAASPTEDAFFFVRPDGLVTKVTYPVTPDD
jgi:hypothetical protein